MKSDYSHATLRVTFLWRPTSSHDYSTRELAMVYYCCYVIVVMVMFVVYVLSCVCYVCMGAFSSTKGVTTSKTARLWTCAADRAFSRTSGGWGVVGCRSHHVLSSLLLSYIDKYIYRCIHRQRERERNVHIHVYRYVYTCIHI